MAQSKKQMNALYNFENNIYIIVCPIQRTIKFQNMYIVLKIQEVS